MAQIDIKYSQEVIDQNNALRQAAGSESSLSEIFDSLIELNYQINTNYYNFTSWNLSGNTLRTTFPNGATTTYNGTVSNPNAFSGTANATNVSFNLPNALTVSQTGSLNYQWRSDGRNLSFYATDGKLTGFIVTTKYPTSSFNYDEIFGNISVRMSGNVFFDLNGNLSGKVDSITQAADRFNKSIEIKGSFDVSGNLTTIGQMLADSSVSGYLSSYRSMYYDGSYLAVDGQGRGAFLPNKQALDELIFSDSSYFPGDDVFNIDLPEKLHGDWKIASGEGNDLVSLEGGGGRLSADTGPGDDSIILLDGNHVVNGGDGFDTAIFPGSRSLYTVTKNIGEITVARDAGAENRNILFNVEILRFDDQQITSTSISENSSFSSSEASNTSNANTTMAPVTQNIKVHDPSVVNDPKVIVTRLGDLTFIEGNYENNTLVGTDAADQLFGGDGSDRFYSSRGNDSIDGGDGTDVVTFRGRANDFRVEKSGSNWLVRDTRADTALNQGEDTLTGVERVAFEDKVLALDTDGVAGKAYRVYKAAFNRDPMQGDTAGLGFWIDRMDNAMDLIEVSARFVDSDEFRTLYGTNPTNDQFLTNLYMNVLGRQPEALGFNWWLNELSTNPEKTKAKVLADFAESAENKAAVIDLIGTGITYEPWMG